MDLATVHILMVLSSEAESRCLPSAVKVMERAAAVWPLQKVLSPVMDGIHTATVPSRQLDAIKLPAGEKHTSVTPALCPENLRKVHHRYR